MAEELKEDQEESSGEGAATDPKLNLLKRTSTIAENFKRDISKCKHDRITNQAQYHEKYEEEKEFDDLLSNFTR